MHENRDHPFLGQMALLGFVRGPLLGAEFHRCFLTQGFLACDGFVQFLSNALNLGLRFALQTRRLLLLRLHLGLHGGGRLARRIFVNPTS